MSNSYDVIVRIFSIPYLTQQWSKVRTSGKKPPAREYHSACIISSDVTGHHPLLMVVGGVVGGQSTPLVVAGVAVFSDVWFLDVTDGSWNEVVYV